jgi:hypothetical protein
MSVKFRKYPSVGSKGICVGGQTQGMDTQTHEDNKVI